MTSVKVKPLEWTESIEPSGVYYSAITPVGGYDVFRFTINVTSGPRTICGWKGFWLNGNQKTETIEEAKEAAQKDYETRILSAIED